MASKQILALARFELKAVSLSYNILMRTYGSFLKGYYGYSEVRRGGQFQKPLQVYKHVSMDGF